MRASAHTGVAIRNQSLPCVKGPNYGCPVAVPKISQRHLSRRNFDRCHSLTSLHLPLAALGSLPPPPRSKKGGRGLTLPPPCPYNIPCIRIYGLLIRCNRCPTAPLRGQAAVKKKWGQTPRDRHCERKKASEAAKFAAGRKLRHCRYPSVRR